MGVTQSDLESCFETIKLRESCSDITRNKCGKIEDTREFSFIGTHKSEINLGGRKRISSL